MDTKPAFRLERYPEYKAQRDKRLAGGQGLVQLRLQHGGGG